MSSRITIIKGRPIGHLDITTIPVVSGIHTIIDTDTIPTLTAIIGTPMPTMAVTGGLGSSTMIQKIRKHRVDKKMASRDKVSLLPHILSRILRSQTHVKPFESSPIQIGA